MFQKKISVVIPVYNAEKYILDAINSILNQTYTNLEIICIDDCSTDNTLKILSSINDNRLFLYRNDVNKGVIYTRSKAYNLCTGDFIANMDADDISYPNRLEKQVLFFNKNPEIDILGSWINKIDNKAKHIGFWKTPETDNNIKATLIFKMSIANPTVMFKSSLKNNLRHDKKFHLVEDYALYCQLALKGYKFANIQEPLLYYRVLEKSMSHAHKKNVELTDNTHKEVYKELFSKLNMPYLNVNTHREFINSDIQTIEQLNRISNHLQQLLLDCPSSYCSQKALHIKISHMWTKACLRASKQVKINLRNTLFNQIIIYDRKSIKNIFKSLLYSFYTKDNYK